MKNYSKQRDDLLSILKNSKTHPTAEELYEKVKLKIPNVSKGTVYRNLKDLADEDYIIKSPVRRIRKVKTTMLVKEPLSDESLEHLRDAAINGIWPW